MNLKYVELHNPLFHAGVNFQSKLDLKRKAGLKLYYDEKRNWVTATYGGQTSYIPISNVASMIEDDGKDTQGKAIIPAVVPQGKIKAQASTPTGIKND